MKVKTVFLKLKQLTTGEGTFEGLLSPYGNVDGGGDVVERGAYTKTLKDNNSKVPLLWQHKADSPIGELHLEDRPDGLWCKGSLLMELPEAQKAYALTKAGIIKGLSIGFQSVKDSIESGVRHLKEIKLYEGSVVTFPMNEQALITAVKQRQRKDTAEDDGPGDFNEELAEVQLWQLPYQLRTALDNAIGEMFWNNGGLAKPEILTSFDTILSQFHDAYMQMLPDYLDAMTDRYGSYEAWSRRVAEIKAKADGDVDKTKKLSSETLETKKGARHSGATKDVVTKAMDACKSYCEGMMADVHDELKALIGDEAGEATSDDDGAAKGTEPAVDHSAFTGFVDEIKSFVSGPPKS